MKRFRQAVALLMILSLSLVLVACGGKSKPDGDDSQAGGEPIEDTQDQQGEPQDDGQQDADPEPGPSMSLRIGSVEGLASEYVRQISSEWGCTEYSSIDSLAAAFISGEVDFAVVPPDVASALYNATGGALMAIDAIAPEEGSVSAASVVSLSFFKQDPESVVSYVSRHHEMVSGTLGEEAFLSGSKMQRELSDEIADYYVYDPTSVGSELPPDNFYFLG